MVQRHRLSGFIYIAGEWTQNMDGHIASASRALRQAVLKDIITTKGRMYQAAYSLYFPIGQNAGHP